MRVAKIKASDGGELMGRLKHSARMFEGFKNDETPNNLYSKKNAYQAFEKYKLLTEGCKKRSDSVGSFEIVFTSSEVPNWKKSDYDKYLDDCIKWAKKQFGAENCFYIAKHYDEKVPHTHMFFTPLERKQIKKKQTKEEKEKGIFRTEWVTHLNAKKFFNGKQALVNLQNDFYDNVSKKYKFSRGTPAEETNRKNQRPQLNYERDKIDEEKTVLFNQRKFIKDAEKYAEDYLKNNDLTLDSMKNPKKFLATLELIKQNRKKWFLKQKYYDLLESQPLEKIVALCEEMKALGFKNLGDYEKYCRLKTNEKNSRGENLSHKHNHSR